jgi:DNA-binding PadR family transcriptional regulator
MKKDRTILTFSQIAQWLYTTSPDAPTIGEIEDSLESLSEKGVIEILWDDNGNVCYRLTDIGNELARELHGH